MKRPKKGPIIKEKKRAKNKTFVDAAGVSSTSSMIAHNVGSGLDGDENCDATEMITGTGSESRKVCSD